MFKTKLQAAIYQALQKSGLLGNFLEEIEWFLKNVGPSNFETLPARPVGRLKPEAQVIIGAKNSLVYLKPRIFAKIRAWWKTLRGHPEITNDYFYLLPLFLNQPQAIFKDKLLPQTFLFMAHLTHEFTIVIEVVEEEERKGSRNEIKTIFWLKPGQLKKVTPIWKNKNEPLAGTATFPILAPRPTGGVAGCGFSSLREAQDFYSRLEKICQADLLTIHPIEQNLIAIEHPTLEKHGDYTTNLALKLAKDLKISPQEIAQKIVQNLRNLPFVEKIEIAAAGFINFTLKTQTLIEEVTEILKKKNRYGHNQKLSGQKIIIEFTDPNPFKEFHIGHLYSNIVGETLSRLLEFSGAEVKRANYQGDVGLHVAKAVWGLKEKLARQNLTLERLEKLSLTGRVKFLGESYALGNQTYEEDPKVKNEIERLNQKIYAEDQSVQDLYQKGKAWSLKHFETIYQRLDTKFDLYYFEKDGGKIGLKLVKEHLAKGVFQESQDAIIFPGEKYGLHNRVFVNSLGLPTYEAKELGLAFLKYRDYPYDQSLIVTGSEIEEYFAVLLTALKLINPELAAKTRHLAHGMVRVPGGKMSSRLGNIVSAEELLDEAQEKVKEIMQKQKVRKDISSLEELSEAVGTGAVKYSLLKTSLGKDLEFSFNESLNFEGNSGPYLQYTHARCRSVLKQKTAVEQKALNPNYQPNPEELAILRFIFRFPEVVEDAAFCFSPNLVCNFLWELAKKFNTFYNRHPILRAETGEQKYLRLALTSATAQILNNGLDLLGIAAPERM